ncbi:uncharacterized mitochondrial protein-like protein [Tanacetum coccineum]
MDVKTAFLYGSDGRSFINQAKYAQEILKKHGMTSCDSIGTPMATKHLDADLSGTPVDQTKYRSMVGALMYLTASRPDIVHATCRESARYQAKTGRARDISMLVKRIFGGDKLVVVIHRRAGLIQCLQQKPSMCLYLRAALKRSHGPGAMIKLPPRHSSFFNKNSCLICHGDTQVCENVAKMVICKYICVRKSLRLQLEKLSGGRSLNLPDHGYGVEAYFAAESQFQSAPVKSSRAQVGYASWCQLVLFHYRNCMLFDDNVAKKLVLSVVGIKNTKREWLNRSNQRPRFNNSTNVSTRLINTHYLAHQVGVSRTDFESYVQANDAQHDAKRRCELKAYHHRTVVSYDGLKIHLRWWMFETRYNKAKESALSLLSDVNEELGALQQDKILELTNSGLMMDRHSSKSDISEKLGAGRIYDTRAIFQSLDECLAQSDARDSDLSTPTPASEAVIVKVNKVDFIDMRVRIFQEVLGFQIVLANGKFHSSFVSIVDTTFPPSLLFEGMIHLENR